MRTSTTVFLALLLSSCAAQPPKPDGTGRLGPLGFTLTEDAQDGQQVMPVGKTFAVDPDSSLELRFDTGLPATPAADDPRWLAVNAWLEETREHSNRLLALNRRQVDERNLGELRRLQNDVNEFNNQTAALAGRAKKILHDAGLSEAQVKAVQYGTFDNKPSDAVSNMTRWVIQERDRLIKEATSKQDRQGDQVVVMAFHKVNGQPRERLHVEHYDTISSGMDLALKRTALGLTDNELAELRMQVDQSERAARVIRQLQESDNALKQLQGLIYGKLKPKLVELQQLVETTGNTIRAELESALAHAKSAPLSPASQEIRAQVDKLTKDIESFKTDWNRVAGIRANIEKIQAAPEATDLSALLFGSAGYASSLKEITDALGGVASWPEKIKAINEQGEKLAATLKATDLQEVLSADFQKETEKIRAAVEPVRVYIAQLLPHGRVDPQVAALAAAGDETIPHKLDDLPPARIDLSGYQFDEGDGLTVRLELHRSLETQQADTPKKTGEYNLSVSQQGWYRRIVGLPIFARAVTGTDDATRWKPNVGVTATWYYRERYPNAFGRFINQIEPGIGLHVASLDQAQESVEFGIGVNISFWKGLLTLGIGKNLSTPDRNTYYLLGSDLFRLLGNLEPEK